MVRILVAALLALAPMTAAAAPAYIPSAKAYHLVTPEGALSVAEGALTVRGHDGADLKQRWVFVPRDAGLYELINLGTGESLAAEGVTSRRAFDPASLWRADRVASGITLRNVSSGELVPHRIRLLEVAPPKRRGSRTRVAMSSFGR